MISPERTVLTILYLLSVFYRGELNIILAVIISYDLADNSVQMKSTLNRAVSRFSGFDQIYNSWKV